MTEEDKTTALATTEAQGAKGEEAEDAGPDEGLRQEALRLRNSADENYWQLGAVLHHIYKQDKYRSWGYESWRDYVTGELDFAIRKAQYLVQLQVWFDTMTPAIQKWMRGLGWAKARLLMHVVKQDNAGEWKNRVAGKSYAEIEAMLKADRESGGGGGGSESPGGGDEGIEVARALPRVVMFSEQRKIYDMAMGKAAEVAQSEKTGHLLAMICQEYLATNVDVLSMNDYLKNAERILALKIIALRESEDPDAEDAVVYGSDYVEEQAVRQARDEAEAETTALDDAIADAKAKNGAH
ncbi:MAG: hypothetical protein JW704_00690 [Anaerolineaceae bacterium]|nr:hypothetical protein [Anaerolineaceae bacterium]